LSKALFWAREQIETGRREVAPLLKQMRKQIESAGPCEIDYIEVVDAEDMQPKQTVEGCCLIALAVKIGPTRLIDNVLVDVGQAAS